MADPITLGAMALTAAATATTAAGTIMGGNAAAEAGQRKKSSYDFVAKQQDQAAQESRAVAQRSSFEKQREGRLLQSKLQARAAAGGGGADDPTVLALGGNIAGRSEYDALFEMYKGENRARGLEDEAMGSRMSGDAALAEGNAKQKAANMAAIGTIIGGASSMLKQYGGPGGTPASKGYG